MRKLLIYTLFLFCPCVYAQDGSLDHTFGIAGKVTTELGSNKDEGHSMAIQSDGKIVVAGNVAYGSTWDFAVVRYNTDGSLDNTFGSGGTVTTDFWSSCDFGKSVAIQSDGKIVVAGMVWTCFTSNVVDLALVRYNTDGSLDTTFGIGGKVTSDFGGPSDVGNSIVIQNDGKIIVAGKSKQGVSYDFLLARYDSAGNPDSTFGTGGWVVTDFGSPYEFAYAVVMQDDGKIVVAGYDNDGNNYDPGHDFVLARYKDDGALDSTFGSGGKVITDLGSLDDYGFAAAIQSDGKILVAGHSASSADGDFALVRYNSDGGLDNSFGSGGIVYTNFGSGGASGYSVISRDDGKIVVGGILFVGYPNLDFALARYNNDGSLDNTFDFDGKVTTDFGGGFDMIYSLAIQSDEKIVAAGCTGTASNHDFALARYNVSTVGMAEKIKTNDVYIYPNPSDGVFTADLHNCQDVKLTVCDVLGNCVLRIDCLGEASQKINLSLQPKGIYFLEILTDGARTVEKIILH